MFIKEAEFVVFDVETTGLNPEKQDRICEIGAVKIKNTKIISSFNSLVNPQRDIPHEATAIHGITQAEVAKAPLFEEVSNKFFKFIGQLPLFGYNVGFDLSFLNAHLASINKPVLQRPCVDILVICRRLLGMLPSFSLSYVAKFFKIPQDTAHRAKQDSLIAASVFFNLLPLLEEKGITSLENLYTIFGLNKEHSFKINTPKVALIQKALKEGTHLQVKYYSLNSNQMTQREVEPLKLENTGGKMVLVSRCLLRRDERNFNLDRILDLKIV